MAVGDVGTITFEDEDKKMASIKFADVVSEAKLKAMADWLKGHSDAKIVSYGVTKAYAGDSVTEGNYDHVAQKMNVLFKDNTTRKMVRASIPAPAENCVNDKQQLDSDVATDFRQQLHSLTGKTLTYRGGYLNSRNPGNLDTEETGV